MKAFPTGAVRPNADACPIPVVRVDGAAVLANSDDVAHCFEKRPDNVVRDIDNLRKGSSKVRSLFAEVLGVSDKGQMRRTFDMGKRGFQMLAMGFTGARAIEFKLAYIDEFERMEAALRHGAAAVDAERQAERDHELAMAKLRLETLREERRFAALPPLAAPGRAVLTLPAPISARWGHSVQAIARSTGRTPDEVRAAAAETGAAGRLTSSGRWRFDDDARRALEAKLRRRHPTDKFFVLQGGRA